MESILGRKNCRDLKMIPIDLSILDEMAFTWGCHDRFWLMMTPNNFILSTLAILLSSMFLERSSRLIFFLEG